MQKDAENLLLMDDRLIVTWSMVRVERDIKTRNDILAKIQKKLGSKKQVNTKSLISNTNYHKFLKGLTGGGKPKVNQEANEANEANNVE